MGNACLLAGNSRISYVRLKRLKRKFISLSQTHSDKETKSCAHDTAVAVAAAAACKGVDGGDLDKSSCTKKIYILVPESYASVTVWYNSVTAAAAKCLATKNTKQFNFL